MIGTVSKWHTQKGTGVLKSGDQEYFVYYKNIVAGSRLTPGAEIAFEVNESAQKKDGLPEAINVMGPGVITETQGSLMGTVCEWHLGKSYGFILGVDGSKVYAHISSFDGAKLSVGKTVTYDITDVGHKSGRNVAISVSGAAVVPVAGTRGITKSWIFGKNFGFVEDAAGNEVFVHGSQIGGGWLVTGKEIFFDTEPGKGEQSEKLSAINVSGPAVRDQEYMGFAGKGMKGGKGGRVAGASGKGRGKGKSGPEKRKDIDGNYYTKSDFFDQYGGYAEWDAKETRMSPTNGNMYTRDMFEKHFGGLDEWNAAKGNGGFSPYSQTKGRGRGGKKRAKKGAATADDCDVEMS